MKISANTRYYPAKTKNAFGYNYETHRVITRTALKQIPDFDIAVEKLFNNQKFVTENNKLVSVKRFIDLCANSKDSFNNLISRLALNKNGFASICSTVGKGTTKAEKFKNEIADASMMPDLMREETGFFTNRHFYFPTFEKLGAKSFGLDTEKNNALSAFIDHIKKAQGTKKSFYNKPFELGMALHFLQDMTVPMHTQRSEYKLLFKRPVLGKAYELLMHKKFENIAPTGMLHHHDELVKNYTPNLNNIKNISENKNPCFLEILHKNVEFSLNPQLQISLKNKENWPQIQQKCFNQAVDSTVVLLNKIKNYFITQNP